MIRLMMDCLLEKCIPFVTDCAMAKLEKLGGKYKIALRLAKDPRFERVPCNCSEKGYADDCLTDMAKQWKCFIVATCDKKLRGRIRKILACHVCTLAEQVHGRADSRSLRCREMNNFRLFRFRSSIMLRQSQNEKWGLILN